VKSCVIFDLDGTLVDSLPGISASLNRTLAAHGLPGHPDAIVRSFVGNGLRNLIERAAPQGSGPSLIESLLGLYRKDYALSWQSGTRTYDGILHLLGELQRDGHPLAVLSNKTHPFTVEMVRETFPAIHFAQVLGQKDHIPHKPAPDGVFQISEALGIGAETCVMVGDSTIDIATAHNAGIRGIAVTWGYHDRARLAEAGAHAVIALPSELPPLLD
jgi:phosphoglycolate phosphatase